MAELKKILLISDILLTISMPVVIITGIMIAKELFVIESGISWILLFNIHNILSYICLGIMAVHILFHAKYIAAVCKKLPSAVSGTEMKSAVTRFSFGALAAVVLYSSLAVFKNMSDKKDAVNIIHEEETYAAAETSAYTTAAKTTTTVYTEITEAVLQDTGIQTEDTEITTQPETTPIPTLEEYLSMFICTGCGRGCSLLSPRCGRGNMQAAQAEEEYNRTYSSN